MTQNDGFYNEIDPVEEHTPKKLFDINKRDFIFAGLLFGLALLAVSFGLYGGFSFGFTLTGVAVFGVLTAYLAKGNKRIKAYPLLCGVLTVALLSVFSVTSNGSVRFFGFVGTVILSLIWCVSLSNRKHKPGDMGLVASVFAPLFEQTFPNIPTTVISIFSQKKNLGKTMGKIALGAGVALPVLLVVVPLLRASDEAFSGLVDNVGNNLFSGAFKVGLALLITVLLLSYCFSLKKDSDEDTKQRASIHTDTVVLASFLSALSVCYVLYLLSQLAYFFSAFKGILPKDYTFTVSEYARRGFFEMSAIGIINFITVYVALLLSVKKEYKAPVIIRVICTFISIFTLLIIGTALSKMALYIKCFGMTELRITTSAFMVFLAVVFVFLIGKIYVPKIEVLRSAAVTAGVILALLGTVNVNRVVAEYNYNAYQTKRLQSIDVMEIYQLGDEGVPYLVALTKDSNQQVAKDAKQYLLQCINDERYYEVEVKSAGKKTMYVVGDKTYNSPEEYTLSLLWAYDALDVFIKENPKEFTYMAKVS